MEHHNYKWLNLALGFAAASLANCLLSKATEKGGGDRVLLEKLSPFAWAIIATFTAFNQNSNTALGVLLGGGYTPIALSGLQWIRENLRNIRGSYRNSY